MTGIDLTGLAAKYKAMGHPVRLRILQLLCDGPLFECEIAAMLGVPQSSISEHVAVLRRNGLVAERREGRWVEFRQTLPLDTVDELRLAGSTDPSLPDLPARVRVRRLPVRACRGPASAGLRARTRNR